MHSIGVRESRCHNLLSPPNLALATRRYAASSASIFTFALLLLPCLRATHAQTPQAADYLRAEILVRNHQWDQGIELLRPLLTTDRSDPKILNLMGLAYTGKRDLEAADQYFEAALKIHPSFAPALKNLAINEAALGEIAPAQQHLTAALKEVPDDPVVNLYLGELLYRQQNFEAAEPRLLQASTLVSRNSDLLASLAVSEIKTGRRSQSVEIFSHLNPEALNLESRIASGVALAEAGLSTQAIPFLEAARAAQPSLNNIAYDLALCYMAITRFPEAIDLLEDQSGRGHETAENDNLLAEAYEAQHQTQKAVDSLRRAIALDPGNDDNYLAFASLCMDHQAFDDANKVLAVALTAHPTSARLLFERGILNAMQNHYDAAEIDFQAAANLSPADNSAYIGLGVTYLETGSAAKAIPLLRTRLRDRPQDANLCYLLAEALLKTEAQRANPALAEAQSLLEKAVRLDPKLVEAHISLGTIYLRQDRSQDAVDQLEQARHLDPNAKSAYSHLAIAYRKLGQQDLSRAALTQLKEINDRERTGSRQPMQSKETGTALPQVSQHQKPASD